MNESKNNMKTIIVDFFAEWCGPCKMISPTFKKLCEECKQHVDVIFVKVDVDNAHDVASQCGISSMPTFQVYKIGNKEDEVIGANQQKLLDMVHRHTAN